MMERRAHGRCLRWTAAALVAASAAWLLAAAPVAYGAPNHLVVIVLENKTFDRITSKNKADAPYINQVLIPTGTLFTNYVAPTPGSVKDYRALTSALIDVTASRSSDNIFNQLQGLAGSGVTWGEFEEDMPSTCFAGGNISPYMKGHNPAVAYTGIKSNSAVCNASVVPYSAFDPANMRSFSFVVPNEFNDMHTGASVSAEIRAGDAWLSQNVPAMLNNGAEVIVTFDEGISTNERVVTLEVGGGAGVGVKNGTAYGHYSLLAGIEDAFGLPRLNNATGAPPLPL
jgi:hypothetical protein